MANFRSLMLTVTAVCALIITSASAFDGGTGEPNDPYKISTPEHLISIGSNPDLLDKHYIMVADVNMAEYEFTTAVIAAGVEDMYYGFEGTPFKGVFDGNYHKVENLTIDTLSDGDSSNDNNSFLGLFGCVDGLEAKVQNLGMDGVDIIGGDKSYFLGGVCGMNYAAVNNCYAIGKMSGGFRCLGGLCGMNSGEIHGCYSRGTVTGKDDYIGGLCGLNEEGIISNCFAVSVVVMGSDCIGGLCGGNQYSGTISECYATGKVTAIDWSVGGLCGSNYFNSIISNSYAAAEVTGGDEAGGLCGSNQMGTISNCYAVGEVKGGNNVGGLCGLCDNATNCCWDIEASGVATSAGGTGLTTAQMQTLATFTGAGWDFDNTWWINNNRDYPKLSWQPFGDLNNDSHVNTADMAIMSASWMMDINTEGIDKSCELSGDNTIDIADLSVFVNMWLKEPQYGD